MHDRCRWVNLNGRIVPAEEAQVSVFDHGLLYGDGLFETLRVYGGRFFRLGAHLARLSAGASQLSLELPWSPEQLSDAIRQTAATNEIADGSVRLTVTRGEGAPAPDPGLCRAPTFFVTARRGDAAAGQGVSVCFTGRHPQWMVPGVKLLCFLPFQLARSDAKARGYDEALLTAGEELVEAATSNVFLAREGRLVTPSLESGCLPGITRSAVLEVARAAGIECLETRVPAAWAGEAEEVFLTNSVAEIQTVVRLDEGPVGEGVPGPVTRRLTAAYFELVQAELS